MLTAPVATPIFKIVTQIATRILSGEDVMVIKKNPGRLCRRNPMVVVVLIIIVFILFTPPAGSTWPEPPSIPADPYFEAPLELTNSPDVIDTLPTLAVDRCGHVHVAFLRAYAQEGAPDGVAFDIFYMDNVSGSFSAPVKIAVPTGYYSHGVTMAVDGNDVVHVAFRRSDDQIWVTSDDDLYYVNNASGVFDSPLVVVDGYSSFEEYLSAPKNPMIAAGPDGVIHLAFLAGSDVIYWNQVFYTNDGGTGTFAAPVMASAGMADPSIGYEQVTDFTMVLDSAGWPHFAFYGTPDWVNADDAVFYVKALSAPVPSPTFSAPEVLFTASSWGLGHGRGPGLAVDATWTAHIVYLDESVLCPNLFYVNNAGGSFGTPEGIFGDGSAICGLGTWIEVDSDGYLPMAYKAGFRHQYQSYANNIGGSWGGTNLVEVSDYSGYSTRHFAIGPGGELDLVYADTLTGDLLDFHIYFIAGNRDNAIPPCGTSSPRWRRSTGRRVRPTQP